MSACSSANFQHGKVCIFSFLLTICLLTIFHHVYITSCYKEAKVQKTTLRVVSNKTDSTKRAPHKTDSTRRVSSPDKSEFTALNCTKSKDRGHLEVNLKRPSRIEFVHQSWKTSTLPPRFGRWASSWKRCFPKARYILWTDKDNRDFIAKHYPWFLKRYDSLPSNIYRADSLRYFYMFHYGGIYTDLDNECLRPFEHLVVNGTLIFGNMNTPANMKDGYVQNSFIYSVARHPVWLEMIMFIMTNKNQRVEFLTGPEAMVNVIKKYRSRNKDLDDVYIYPPQYFNPLSWTGTKNTNKHCKLWNGMSDDELKKCRETYAKTSYVVQYHTHIWGGGKILRRLL